MKFFVKGVMIIGVIILVWIIYFILNFIDPTLFNFLRTTKKVDTSATTTVVQKPSLGYKIYNLFFKSRATQPVDGEENSSTTVSKNSKSSWGASSTPVVWGGKNSTVWGGSQYGSSNALEGLTFVYANTQNSPIRGMKINALLINENNFNYLPDGGIISGAIYTGFLSSYYFNADIYNIDGVFLFSIPITSSHDLNTESFSNFYGKYSKNINATNYKGKGYMVIKSDDNSVTGSVLVKIELK